MLHATLQIGMKYIYEIADVEGVKRNKKIFKQTYNIVCHVESVEGSVHTYNIVCHVESVKGSVHT